MSTSTAVLTVPSSSRPSALDERLSQPPPAPPERDLSRRLAGAGAATFAVIVVGQNAVRGSAAPMPGASGADVLEYYADHRAVTTVLLASFLVGAVSLAAFVGGSMRSFLTSARRGWAITGLIGAIGVIAMFAGVVASEQALTVLASGDGADTATAESIWALHNSLFTVNFAFIALALVGLSRAGIATGTTPRPFRWLAPIGAGLLSVGTVAGAYIAAGDAAALFGIATTGFVVWLAFLVTTSTRLLRRSVTR